MPTRILDWTFFLAVLRFTRIGLDSRPWKSRRLTLALVTTVIERVGELSSDSAFGIAENIDCSFHGRFQRERSRGLLLLLWLRRCCWMSRIPSMGSGLSIRLWLWSGGICGCIEAVC